jgi:hypothetical protein
MKENHEKIDSEFRELFVQYMDDIPERDYDEILYQLREMVIDNRVSSATVVKTISDMLKLYPSKSRVLLHIMWDFSGFRVDKGLYHYPEFFWIVYESNVLSDIDKIYDITKYLRDFGGHDITRTYLTYLLVTADKSHHKNIVSAFYYTGHNIESLRTVIQIVPWEENKSDLYKFVYSGAMSFVHHPRAKSLTEEEKAFLRDFFERGLTWGDESIVDSCKKALEKLGELSLDDK